MPARRPPRPSIPHADPPLMLEYDGDVDHNVLRLLEHHARATGLSLAMLDLLGTNARAAFAFIEAAEDGDVTAFIEATDWQALEAKAGW